MHGWLVIIFFEFITTGHDVTRQALLKWSLGVQVKLVLSPNY